MFQEVTLIGNLGRDPEMRYTPDGVPVCNFSLATEETWKNKVSGERQKKVTWHQIVLWRNRAETAAQYLKKGGKILLKGRIQIREYEDKDGIKRRAFEIVGDFIKMMGDGSQANGNGHEQDAPPIETTTKTETKTEAQPQAQPAQPSAPVGDGAYSGGPPLGGDDDDLPF